MGGGGGGGRGDLFGIWCSQCILYGYFYYVPQVLNMFSLVVVVVIIIIIIITLNICVNNITLFGTFFLENHRWGEWKNLSEYSKCAIGLLVSNLGVQRTFHHPNQD
jgi:hypothetical protein